MKEMVYKAELETEILHEGVYQGRKFVILSRGYHPTAYIQVKDYEPHIRDYYDLDVNGGATYFGKAYWDEADINNYVGWDYIHYGDFSGLFIGRGNVLEYESKKWTTQEIFEEVKTAIEQLNNGEGIRK